MSPRCIPLQPSFLYLLMSYWERRGRYISLELAEKKLYKNLRGFVHMFEFRLFERKNRLYRADKCIYTCLSLGYLKGKIDFIEQISVFTSHNLYEFNGSNQDVGWLFDYFLLGFQNESLLWKNGYLRKKKELPYQKYASD